MLRRIALWLLDRLRSHLDPELQAEFDRYKEQAKQQAAQLALLQQQVVNLDREYKAALDARRSIKESLDALELENSALEEMITKVRYEKTDLSRVSDSDALRNL